MSDPGDSLSLMTLDQEAHGIKHMFERVLSMSPVSATNRTSVRRTYVRTEGIVTAVAMNQGLVAPYGVRRTQRSTVTRQRGSAHPVASARPRIRVIDTPQMRRRRRTVVVLLLAAVAAVVGPQAFAGGESAEPVVFDTYTVAQGETLWDIASAYTAVGADVRDTLAEISQLNALSSSGLAVGQQLRVPTAD